MNKLALIFENTWTEAIGWTLLHSLWIGALLCLLWRLSLLGKRSPQWRYLSSLITLAGLFVMVMLTFGWELSQLNAEASLEIEISAVQAATSPNSSPVTPNVTEESHLLGNLETWVKPYFPWISLVWLGGIFILSLRLVGGWLYLEFLRRSGKHIVPLQWQEQVESLRLKMNIKRHVRLLESNLLGHPITMGFFKPIILFPIGMISQMSPAQIEAILLHELAHIKRADYLVNYFQSLVEIVLFYHPAVWWISQDLRESREHCCDDLALSQGYDRWQYAQALLQLTKTNSSSKTIFAMSLTGNKHSQLSRRIQRLFGRYTPDRFMSRGLLMAILLSGSLMTWAFHHAPPSNESPLAETNNAVEKLLFTIKPSHSVAEVQAYNKLLRQYGFELETVVRDEAKNIIEITIAKTVEDEFPIVISNFKRFSVYLTPNQEQPISFKTDGVISTIIEEEGESNSFVEEPIMVEGVETVSNLTPDSELQMQIAALSPLNVWEEEGNERPQIMDLPSPAFVLEGKVLNLPPGEQIPPELRTYLGPNCITMKVVDNKVSILDVMARKEPGNTRAEQTSFDTTIVESSKISIYKEGVACLSFTALPAHLAQQKLGPAGANGAILIKKLRTEETNLFEDEASDKKERLSVVNGELINPQPKAETLEPLFVVNGKLMDQRPAAEIKTLIGEVIDPNDIESINVVKGEVAIEKWGEQAQDGAIELLLKEEAMPIEIQSLFEENSPAIEPLILLNGKELSEYPISQNLLFDGYDGRVPKLLPSVADDVATIDIRKGRELFGEEGRDVIDIRMKAGALNDLLATKSANIRQSERLQIFPNPSEDQVYVQFELAEAAHTKIWISDMTGRVVMRVIDLPLAQGPQEIEFEAKKLASGTYIVNLQYENELLQRKLIVE